MRVGKMGKEENTNESRGKYEGKTKNSVGERMRGRKDECEWGNE